MNREQIIEKWDGMTPHERDAWVAEVVFGEDVYICDRVPYCLRERQSIRHCKCEGRKKAQSYTTDISAAWEVVKKSAEWGGLAVSLYGNKMTRYYVVDTCTDNSPREVPFQVSMSEAPEAICLAALIAKLI